MFRILTHGLVLYTTTVAVRFRVPTSANKMFRGTILSVAAFAAIVSASPAQKRQSAPAGVPDYVLRYGESSTCLFRMLITLCCEHQTLTSAAPLLYLHSGEQYFPTDLNAFLANTVPQINFQTVSTPPYNLNNLNTLDPAIFLTSKDDITKNPTWIKGTKPDQSGKTQNAITAAIIVNDKGAGNVDAFYMFFYAYNYGGNVLGLKQLNFGNHVGDWEHLMLRFKNGKPEWVWFSQHANGQAFAYGSLKKQGERPVAYVSKGSHANYAITGKHDHVIPNLNLPGGVLEDDTNAGTLWDPTLCAFWYAFNETGKAGFRAYDASGATPTGYLGFRGRWGDQEYSKSDKRQVKLFGQAKFSNGVTGPVDKQLGRKEVCPDNGLTCIYRRILVPRRVGDGS